MSSSSTHAQGWLRAAATLAAAAAVLGSSGCFKATFINPAVTPGETHEEWTDFFIGGLVGTEEFDVREFCPGEAAKVATGGNFLTGLVSVVTIGIYVPRKVYVTCAAAPPAQPTPAPATMLPVPPAVTTATPPQAPPAGTVPAPVAPAEAGSAPPVVAPTTPATAPAPSPATPSPAVPAPGGAR